MLYMARKYVNHYTYLRTSTHLNWICGKQMNIYELLLRKSLCLHDHINRVLTDNTMC